MIEAPVGGRGFDAVVVVCVESWLRYRGLVPNGAAARVESSVAVSDVRDQPLVTCRPINDGAR